VNHGVDNPAASRLLEQLEAGAKQLSVSLSGDQAAKLVDYVLMLDKWNRVYNLTSVRRVSDMVSRHLLDSLSVLAYLPEPGSVVYQEKNNIDVMDVGTGAGLPVLPLAICRPDLRFLSVESNGKKTRFQQQVVMDLGLSNVRIEQKRVEDVFDHASVIVSRAFTAPMQFLQAIEKNTIKDSRIIIMLGLKEHMPDVLPSGFVSARLHDIAIPGNDAERHIALCTRK